MLIGDLASAGAGPALENLMRFSAQRQRLLAHNIANITTPGFQQMDVSIPDFQDNLRRAIEERRSQTGGELGEVELDGTSEIKPQDDGSFELVPKTPSGGILYHDGNNRSLEQLMQGLAENASTFRMATDFLRNRNDMLRNAISQRV